MDFFENNKLKNRINYILKNVLIKKNLGRVCLKLKYIILWYTFKITSSRTLIQTYTIAPHVLLFLTKYKIMFVKHYQEYLKMEHYICWTVIIIIICTRTTSIEPYNCVYNTLRRNPADELHA